MIKLILIISFLLSVNSTYGQYIIEPRVKFEYDSLLNTQPEKVQQIRYMEPFEDGFALLLKMEEDTLNLQDFTPIKNDIKIYSVDENGNIIPDEPQDTFKYNQFLFMNAAFINDTLDIKSHTGPFSGFGISVKLIGSKTLGGFMEFGHKYYIHRNKLSDSKSSEVYVTASVKSVEISEMPKNPGDILYGKISLTTAPFYVDDYNFKNG